MAGIGPVPLCGMILADLGADIIRIDRKQAATRAPPTRQGDTRYVLRGRRSVGLDLKTPEAVDAMLRIIDSADGLIEGFRPGVMERLGLGPEVARQRNPHLVYGRMTGWGQSGPLAQAAGHDINYIALTGALHAIGPRHHKPSVPLNLIGDFGGGALFLAVGLLAALLEAKASGKGQVLDAAVVDGTASLMAAAYSLLSTGGWREERGSNLLDGGAHFYDVYETKDGKYISLGCIEPQFYQIVRQRLLLTDPAFDAQMDARNWPALKERMAAAFKSKTRDEWCALLEGTDACFAPVLSMEEAPRHAHNIARGTFVRSAGRIEPAPAPRFSRTQAELNGMTAFAPADAAPVLQEWGFSAAELARLAQAGVI